VLWATSGPAPSFRRVADSPDRGELLTALTTEHFTLQGARSQTMSESSSRAALLRFADRLLSERTGGVEALFPSPSADGALGPARQQ
jgi:hypothetical protein